MNTQQHMGQQYQHPVTVWSLGVATAVLFGLRSFTFSRRVVVSTVASIIGLLLAGVFLYETHALPFLQVQSASAADVPSGIVSQPAAAASAATTKTAMHEMHIANNGYMLL